MIYIENGVDFDLFRLFFILSFLIVIQTLITPLRLTVRFPLVGFAPILNQ